MHIKDASLDGSYISMQRILRQTGGLDFSTSDASVLVIKDRQEIRMITLDLEKQHAQVLTITQCEEENAGWIFTHSLIVERYLNKIIITTTSTSRASEGKGKERKILQYRLSA